MQNTATIFSILALALGVALAGNSVPSIQNGGITYSAGHYLAGEVITTGYDDYGYNYGAHMFNGSYANVYLGGDGFPPYEGDDDAYLADNPGAAGKWYWPYRDVNLLMKWNDAWISNEDRDGDGKLDRHYGHASWADSGAWETNLQSGVDADGKKWTYFVKIVAVPSDATTDGGTWYAADGTEIGPRIWGAFAVVEEVTSGEGAFYVSPSGPGFGKWGDD